MTAPSRPRSRAARAARDGTPVSVGAAIDIGSNSVHLLVALVGAGRVESLRDTSELLGLGDVVDAHGRIPAADCARVVEVVKRFQEHARRSHADRVIVMGTEPLRGAANADELAHAIQAATGLTLRVLTAREEAVLTFVGVTRGDPPSHPLIVADIGGGSTEVLTFIPGRGAFVDHIPVGSARLTNSIVQHDPPTADEISRIFSAASDATALFGYRGGVQDARTRRLRAVFVGGTATNVARLGRLTRSALARDARKLQELTFDKVTVKYNVKPRRARQLAAGVAIVDMLLQRYGLETADVSEASLRDGAIIAAARHGDGWADALEAML